MKYIIIYLLVSIPYFLFSQDKCVSHKIIENQIANAIDPQSIINEINLLKNNHYTPTKSTNCLEIPIVFHIIHNGDSIGENENISDSQILAQIERLNIDFRGMNLDTSSIPLEFKSFFSDVEIEFCLAKIDPNQNFTTGINRYDLEKNSWDEDSIVDFIKPQTIWNRNYYLNIWSCAFKGTLTNVNGFATPPLGTTSPIEDGIVLNYSRIGNDVNNEKGRTLAHEIGHWLGLFHIWGDDIGACTGDDGINDTPNQGDSYQNCPFVAAMSCGSNDMYMNYMDYTDDACSLMFTKDQKNRMHSVLNGFRVSLESSQACDVTDIIINEIIFPNGTVCQEYFTPAISIQNIGKDTVYNVGFDFYIDDILKKSFSKDVVLFPNEIYFLQSDESLNTTLGLSLEAKFVLTTTEVNEYDLNNADSINFNTIQTGNGFPAELSESFDSGNFPPTNFFVDNFGFDNTWEEFDGSNNTCMTITNNPSNIGNIDGFSTTDYDIFSTLDVEYFLEFDYLHRNNPGFPDKLTVQYSTDCGAHWFPIWTKSGSDLSHNSSDINPFIYIDEAFNHAKIQLDSIFNNSNDFTKVRFRFENKSAGGNNIYLDNINFSVLTSIQEEFPFSLSIFPNPIHDLLQVSLENSTIFTIEIYDFLGNKIFNKNCSNVNNSIDLSSFANGIYIVKLQHENHSINKKIIKK